MPAAFPSIYQTPVTAAPGANVTTPQNTAPTPGSAPQPRPVQSMASNVAAPAPQHAQLAAQTPASAAAPANPVGNKPKAVGKNNWFDNVMENPWLQTAMLGASFIPVVGTGLNAAFWGVDAARLAAKGDYGRAAASGLFAVPGVGMAARVGKGALTGARAVQGAGRLAGAWQGAKTAETAARAAQATTGLGRLGVVPKGLQSTNVGVRGATQVGRTAVGLAPAIGASILGNQYGNRDNRFASGMQDYNERVADYTSQGPLYQAHYDWSQGQNQTAPAGSLQYWGQ